MHIGRGRGWGPRTSEPRESAAGQTGRKEGKKPVEGGCCTAGCRNGNHPGREGMQAEMSHS